MERTPEDQGDDLFSLLRQKFGTGRIVPKIKGISGPTTRRFGKNMERTPGRIVRRGPVDIDTWNQAVMADEEGFDLLPTDTFVAVLVRLPTSARRRSRLVCKRWRDVIDERTAERQVRTKILAFNSEWRSSRVVVFDDQHGRRRHECRLVDTILEVVELLNVLSIILL
nr:unnamed protein product [Digitaria exilis]